MNSTRSACLALLLNAIASGASAQSELEGTLFTSPEQRAYLDYLRQEFLSRNQERGFDITATDIPDIPLDDTAEEPAAPQVYTLSGIVTLRDGTRRIWLNGQALTEHELPDGVSLVQADGAPALRFRSGTGNHVLRPGQTLELSAGEVAENFAFRMPVTPGPGVDVSTPATAVSDAETGPATAVDPALSAIGDGPAADGATLLDPAQAAQLLELMQQWQEESDDD